jgi:hypothetical protein
MAYIIENANILKQQTLQKASLLVEKGKITSIRDSFPRYSFMKMNAEDYIMAPAQVMYDPAPPLDRPFSEQKSYFINEMLMKGMTSFLTFAEVRQESRLFSRIKTVKSSLISSPADYVIAVKVPARLLSPSFIRKCRKEKIPAVFVEAESKEELSAVPWGWIREAVFPYNCPLVPVFKTADEKAKKALQHFWKQLMAKERLAHLGEELREREPIAREHLALMGICPHKGDIRQGGEVSYNLYVKDGGDRNIEESGLFHYYSHRLAITAHKGTIIRAGGYFRFCPGYGERVIIKIPAFFTV